MQRRLFALVIAILIIISVRFILQKQQNTEEQALWEKWSSRSWKSLYTSVNLTLNADSLKADSLVVVLDSFFTQFTENFQSRGTLDQKVRFKFAGDTIALNDEEEAILQYADEKYEQTQGRIHPGIGNLIRLWGLEWGQKPVVPDDSSLRKEQQELKKKAYLLLSSQGNDSASQLLLLRDSLHLALGAFSKGWALEKASAILKNAGIKNFLLEIGGDLVYSGKSPRGKNWRIGVQNPDSAKAMLGALSLGVPGFDAMATSGGYEQYFTDAEGKRHHHILDPLTAQSISHNKSVTIYSKSGAESDFLATWLFILPTDSAISLLENDPLLEGVLVPQNGKVYVSSGLRSLYEPF
jgi:thiamine biosynthesis lipoprotein